MYDVVSQNFSIYLNSICNFSSFLETNNSYVNLLYDKLKLGYYIGSDYKEEIKKYPKYLDNFIPITKTHLFNYPRIYETSLEDSSVLVSLIPKELLHLKNSCDKIPNKKDQIQFESAFEKLYYYSITQSYNHIYEFLVNQNIRDYRNHFYKFFGSESSELFSNLENFQQIVNACFISNYIRKTTDFSSQISQVFIKEDLLNKSNISRAFNNFFEDETSFYANFIESLNDILLKKNYIMFNPTVNLRDFSKDIIDDHIEILKDNFYSFLDSRNYSFNRQISSILSGSINQALTFEFLKNFNNGSCLNNSTNYFKTWSNFDGISNEENYISYYLNSFKQYTLRQYIFVWSVYKSYPEKFLNISPNILKDLVDNYIYKYSDYDDFLDQYVSSPLLEYYSNINYSEYYSIYSSYINEGAILDIFQNKDNLKISFVLLIFPIIDNFIESDYFGDFLDNFLKDHQTKLFENGFIDYYFNWYENRESFKLFFNVFLKKQILNGVLFSDLITEINSSLYSYFTDPLSSYSLTFYDGEEDIEEKFRRFCQLSTSVNQIKKLIQNTLYTTITKQLYINIMDYYRIK